MILAIAVSVYLILMNFIAVVVDSFMYYANITTLITTDHHGYPKDPFFRCNSMRKNLVLYHYFFDI